MTGLDRYIGVPFIDRGRTLAGADCWGLARLAARDLFGYEVPSYVEDYATSADRREVARLMAAEMATDWARAACHCPGLFVHLRFIAHVGIIVAPGLFLHSRRRVGSIVNRLETYRDMIEGCYWYKPAGRHVCLTG